VDGVIRAIAGYAGGGKSKNSSHKDDDDIRGSSRPPPSYDDLQDFTEAIWVEFDPTVISYAQLLTEWTCLHKPTDDQSKVQRYKSVLWYLDVTQQRAAEQVVAQWKVSVDPLPLYTAVLPVTTFYPAEDYHQDYYLLSGQARFIQ
jgi:peptide methionine sulfoxide reductase MsrA